LLRLEKETANLEKRSPSPLPSPRATVLVGKLKFTIFKDMIYEEREKRRLSRNIPLAAVLIAGYGNDVTFRMEYNDYCRIIRSEVAL